MSAMRARMSRSLSSRAAVDSSMLTCFFSSFALPILFLLCPTAGVCGVMSILKFYPKLVSSAFLGLRLQNRREAPCGPARRNSSVAGALYHFRERAHFLRLLTARGLRLLDAYLLEANRPPRLALYELGYIDRGDGADFGVAARGLAVGEHDDRAPMVGNLHGAERDAVGDDVRPVDCLDFGTIEAKSHAVAFRSSGVRFFEERVYALVGEHALLRPWHHAQDDFVRRETVEAVVFDSPASSGCFSSSSALTMPPYVIA